MIVRYLSSAAAGILVTTSLLWVMQFLIERTDVVNRTEVPRNTLDWVRVRDDSTVKSDEWEPEPIPDPADPPRQRPSVTTGDGPIHFVPPPPPTPTGHSETGSTGIGYADSPVVSIVNVQPEYPLSASERGIEGYVIVRFDVTATGTVANVSIIESSHRIFEKPAMRAAERARYKPRVIDGSPLTTTGLQKLFRFELEQD